MKSRDWKNTVYGKRVEQPEKGIALFRHKDNKKIIRGFTAAIGGWGNTSTFPDKNGKPLMLTPLGLPRSDNWKDPLGVILTEEDFERLGIELIDEPLTESEKDPCINELGSPEAMQERRQNSIK